jgi:4-hydroxy-2-oxoheptanedioate aldolase
MRTPPSVALLPFLAMLLLVLAAAEPVDAQDTQRFIRMIELLDRGEVVFGESVPHRSVEGAVAMSRSTDSDFLFYDMEHSTFDVPQLQAFLQFLLDPARILARGRPGTEHPVMVRIPANGREMNQWMVKNLLDQGVHGIIAPFIENAAQAENLVRAMRYPQPPGATNPSPPGERGSGAGAAVRYWGVPGAEYRQLADLWRLSPRGELLNLMLIENEEGVRNIREIAQVPGVTVIVPAPGDLNSYYSGDREKVEEAIQTVLAACLEFDVPCGITAGPNDVVERIEQGFRVLITGGEGLRLGREAAGRH